MKTHTHKSKKAFTIIELVIVIATIAVLAGVSINYMLRAKEKSTMNEIANAINNMIKTNIFDDEVGYYAQNLNSFDKISEDSLTSPINIDNKSISGWSIQSKTYSSGSATKHYYLIEQKQGKKTGIKCEFWYKKTTSNDNMSINVVCGSGDSDKDIDYRYLLSGIVLKISSMKDYPEFENSSSASSGYKYICPSTSGSGSIVNASDSCTYSNVFKSTNNTKSYTLNYKE